MAVSVRTHTYITPANPTYRCDDCAAPVERWPVLGPPVNLPCGHRADYHGDPAWSPVP